MDSTNLECGIDEAGRGPWAGPVTACAVILPKDFDLSGLTDSKKLTERKRLALEPDIKSCAIAWSLGWASAQEIDEHNIRQATHLAMRRAVAGLSPTPGHFLVDGNDAPDLGGTVEAIIKGDGKIPSISAASILAKCARDRFMQSLDAKHPCYGFGKHKGYGVAAHAAALNALGPCVQHRLSFKPVREAAERAALMPEACDPGR